MYRTFYVFSSAGRANSLTGRKLSLYASVCLCVNQGGNRYTQRSVTLLAQTRALKVWERKMQEQITGVENDHRPKKLG